RPGEHVRDGDELIELDTTGSHLEVDRVSGAIASKGSENTQLRLKLDDTIAGLEAQIEQKKLDREILRYKAEQNAAMHREGLVSAQDDLAAATAAKKCDIELEQLQQALVRAHRTGAAQISAADVELAT